MWEEVAGYACKGVRLPDMVPDGELRFLDYDFR